MKTEFDILVVGELNIDLILNNIASIPKIGTEIIANKMDLTLGSSSAIFASNVSTLGSRTSFIGKIGNDSYGEFILHSLKKKNVDTSSIIVSDTEKTGATIVLNYSEDRAMITFPGAMKELSSSDISDDTLKKAKHLHISSIFLQPKLKTSLKDIFIRAKSFGLTTSLDIQWDPDEKWDINFKNILPLVDVFLPNEKELLAITNKNNIDDAINSIKYTANAIVVKMGNNGALVYYKGDVTKKASFLNKNVVDAIGAGDSFNAGFINSFVKNEDFATCLINGNLMGAINTTGIGGTGAFQNISTVKETALNTFNFKL